MCLGDVGLHQYGLKIDLVTRLLEYYKKNPSKVPKPPLSSTDIAKEVLNIVMFNVFKTVDPTSMINPDKLIVVDNGLGGNVSLSSAGGVYSMNGKQIPVLGTNHCLQADTPATPVDPKVAENEKIVWGMWSLFHEWKTNTCSGYQLLPSGRHPCYSSRSQSCRK